MTGAAPGVATSAAATGPTGGGQPAAGRTFARPLDAVDVVDGVEAVDVVADGTGWLVRATKTVRRDDPYMSGHFPGLTVYPAAFLLESVRQAVGAALRDHVGEWLEIESIHHLRLANPALDGERLQLTINVVPDRAALRVRAQAQRADGTPVAAVHTRLVPGGVDER